MVKAVKIYPDKIIEISNYENDEDYKNVYHNVSALHVPKYWDLRRFTLTLFTKSLCDKNDEVNPLATICYNKFKFMDIELDEIVRGIAFCVCESGNKIIDFSVDDFHYLMDNIKNIDRKKIVNETSDEYDGVLELL